MTITDIITEYGAYYLANRANLTNLKNKLFTPTETEKHFRMLPMAGTRYETAYGIMSRITQPWKSTWSPINDALEMKPKVIELQKLKIDIDENPDAYEVSWLGFLARMEMDMAAAGKNLDRTQWPFIRWYLEEWVIPQHKEDLELNEYFWGIQTAPPGGDAPGDAGTIMDGLNKIIDDKQTAGVMPTVATGAIEADDDDFVTQCEDMVRDINTDYPYVAGRPMKMFMSQLLFQKYLSGYRTKYQLAQDFRMTVPKIIDRNVEVVGLNSMNSDPAAPGTPSEKIFVTLPENCVLPTKLPANKNYFQVEGSKRTVNIFTDYFAAIGFEQDQYVFANEL